MAVSIAIWIRPQNWSTDIRNSIPLRQEICPQPSIQTILLLNIQAKYVYLFIDFGNVMKFWDEVTPCFRKTVLIN